MAKIKTNDILGIGLLLISISFAIMLFLSFFSLWIKIIGIVGSIMVFIAELTYLFQLWNRKNGN